MAENLISPNKGKAECVAGQENLAGEYTTDPERLSSGVIYDGYVIERSSIGSLYRRDLEAESIAAVATGISPPSSVVRTSFVEAGGDLYFATDDGVKFLDGATSSPELAEVPKGLAPYLVSATSGTAIPDGSSVAYRTTISKLTAEGVWREGAPGGRVVGTNDTGDAGSMNVYTNVPMNAEVGDRLRIYRTTTAASGDPGDIMYLAHEHILESADITVDDGYQLNSDNTPDALLGEALYTNATSLGIQRQNERPPLAKVLVAFDDYLLAFNVKGPQRIVIRLLAPLAVNDTVTINGLVYTAKDPATSLIDGDFDNGDSFGLTVSEQIAYQMVSLARTIRVRTGNSTVRADYLSSQNDPPGILGLEAIDLTTNTFTVTSSEGDSFEPNLTSAQSSIATEEKSGCWASKRGDHWSFPPLRSAGTGSTYRLRIGTQGRDVLAAAALRDAVIVFTNGEGIFKLKRTGAESWRADSINSTIQLLVPESVAVVDNQVIALTTRGIVAVDEGGVEEIDLPIKDRIEEIKNLGPDVVLPYTFAIADDARIRYILYHPVESSDDYATHAWVWNGETGVWTERTDPASGGFVGADDGLLYLGSATDNVLTRERTGTAAQKYKRPDNTPIPARLEWTVMAEGDPATQKQYTEMRLITEQAITGDVTFTCTNDLGGTESVTGGTSGVEDGEPFVAEWVPDGCQRTSKLHVIIERDVFEEAFTVLGFKALTADQYDGSLAR